MFLFQNDTRVLCYLQLTENFSYDVDQLRWSVAMFVCFSPVYSSQPNTTLYTQVGAGLANNFFIPICIRILDFLKDCSALHFSELSLISLEKVIGSS